MCDIIVGYTAPSAYSIIQSTYSLTSSGFSELITDCTKPAGKYGLSLELDKNAAKSGFLLVTLLVYILTVSFIDSLPSIVSAVNNKSLINPCDGLEHITPTK